MMKLLIKLFDHGIGEDRILEKNKTITLHATLIHNQIVIEYSYDMEERKESTAKQKKALNRLLREFQKKYNAAIHFENTESKIKAAIILQNR